MHLPVYQVNYTHNFDVLHTLQKQQKKLTKFYNVFLRDLYRLCLRKYSMLITTGKQTTISTQNTLNTLLFTSV